MAGSLGGNYPPIFSGFDIRRIECPSQRGLQGLDLRSGRAVIYYEYRFLDSVRSNCTSFFPYSNKHGSLHQWGWSANL